MAVGIDGKEIKNMMSMKEAAECLGITKQQMGNLVRGNRSLFNLAIKVGNMWVLDSKQVKEFKLKHFIKRY